MEAVKETQKVYITFSWMRQKVTSRLLTPRTASADYLIRPIAPHFLQTLSLDLSLV